MHLQLPPALLLCLSLLLAACSSPPSQTSSSKLGHKPGPRNFSTVVLDAGHGGKDSGAVRNGLREKDLALDMVRRIQSKLQGSFRVKQMRSGDSFVDLDRRASSASSYGNAVLVSVHFNAGPSRLSGPETFYWRVDSYGLARRLQSAMKSVSPGSNSRGLVRRRLRLTRNPTLPCVLIECGYLSNRGEAASIRSESYRDRLAAAIASAIKDQSRLGDGAVTLPSPRWDPPSKGSDARDSW
jgi:N-acetylmuramoyl-L-alanine amidase